jgi:hypothetical protein
MPPPEANRSGIMATLLDHSDLRARGIKYSMTHLRRLWQAGLFPKPMKTGTGGPGAKNTWTDRQIDRYEAERIAARDDAAA